MVFRAQAQSHNGLTTNNYRRNRWIPVATRAFLPITLGLQAPGDPGRRL